VEISYEEYYPYGSTSYQAADKNIKAAAKRYRYTGKERDDETGLYYYGARYYAPWLGRWVSCDPIGISDSLNLYEFAHLNPIRFMDPIGTDVYEDLSGRMQRHEEGRPEGTKDLNEMEKRISEKAKNPSAWYLEKKRQKLLNEVPPESDLNKHLCSEDNKQCSTLYERAHLLWDPEAGKALGFFRLPGSIEYYNLKGDFVESAIYDPPINSVMSWEYLTLIRSLTQIGGGLLKKGIHGTGKLSRKGINENPIVFGKQFEKQLAEKAFNANINLNTVVSNFPVVDMVTQSQIISVATGSVKTLKKKFFALFGYGVKESTYLRMLNLLRGQVGQGFLRDLRFINQAILAIPKAMKKALLRKIFQDPQGQELVEQYGKPFIKKMISGN
jgi:RHS repeat-associated protein